MFLRFDISQKAQEYPSAKTFMSMGPLRSVETMYRLSTLPLAYWLPLAYFTLQVLGYGTDNDS